MHNAEIMAKARAATGTLLEVGRPFEQVFQGVVSASPGIAGKDLGSITAKRQPRTS